MNDGKITPQNCIDEQSADAGDRENRFCDDNAAKQSAEAYSNGRYDWNRRILQRMQSEQARGCNAFCASGSNVVGAE